MAYDHYTDSNGVTWTIGGKGYVLLAYVLDDANPRYMPPAEDFSAKMDTGGIEIGDTQIIGHDAPTAQQTQTLFLELRGKIDDYAKEHRANVALLVTARPSNIWLWLALGIGALIVVSSER